MATKEYEITIFGSGYVGMSLAVLLSLDHNVNIIDLEQHKVDKINSRKSPVKDSLYLSI